MAQNITGVKESTPNPSITFRIFKAAVAITKGNVLRHMTSGDSGLGGYSTSYYGMSVAVGAANTIPVGVAMSTVAAAAAAAGAFLKVQTGGLGQQDLTTGGSADAGTLLYTGAAGATAESALGSITDGDIVLGTLGIALAADSSTTLAAGNYVLFPMGAW